MLPDSVSPAKLKLVPCSIAEARRFVQHHHRHNMPDQGALFALGVESDGQLVGVAVVGRPKGRGMQDGRTVEITRVCTDGTRNACSFLYSRCRRAAAAHGYERVLTYTRQDEGGASPRAAGFEQGDLLKARSWKDASIARPRVDRLFRLPESAGRRPVSDSVSPTNGGAQ